MVGVHEIDALVVGLPRALHRVRAADQHVAGLRPHAGRVEERPEPRAGPLGDRAPAFHAVVAGDLGAGGEPHMELDGTVLGALHQPPHLEAPVREAGGGQGAVGRGAGVDGAVAREHRGARRFRELAGERAPPRQGALHGLGEALAAAQEPRDPRRLGKAVAAGQERGRGQGQPAQHEAAPVERAGLRHRDVRGGARVPSR